MPTRTLKTYAGPVGTGSLVITAVSGGVVMMTVAWADPSGHLISGLTPWPGGNGAGVAGG